MSAITLTDLEPLPELPELDLSRPISIKSKKSITQLESVLKHQPSHELSSNTSHPQTQLPEDASLVSKDSHIGVVPSSTTKLLPRPQSLPIPLTTPLPARNVGTVEQAASAIKVEATTVMDDAAVPASAERVQWIDALRGFLLLLFMAGGFGAAGMAKLHPGSAWAAVAPYLQNATWVGCHVMDLLQPGLFFLVGVSMALSYRKLTQASHSGWHLLDRTVQRTACFILLGLLLATDLKAPGTEWQFTHMLTQVGLGLLPLYLLWHLGRGTQTTIAVIILVGYWAWFAFTPWSQVAVDQAALGSLKEGTSEGLFTHWTKDANAAAMLDRWFLNLPLFGRSTAFTQHAEGLTTWNFIPSIVTMLLGLIAGNWLLTANSDTKKISCLILSGLVLVALGWWAGETVCPVIRALWTPSWVLFSGGCTLLLSVAFMALGQLLRLRWLLWPLAILGMNALVAYLLYELAGNWMTDRVVQHFGTSWMPADFAPVIHASLPLAVIWLICFWLYRCEARLRI